MKASVAHPADHLVAVVLLGEQPEGGLDHSTTQPEHQVESALLLDVVVREGPAVLQLLTSEDEPLLVGRDPFLVLNNTNVDQFPRMK